MASNIIRSKIEPITFGQRLEELFASWWWVVLFIIGCYLIYEQGLQKKDRDFVKLQTHYRALEQSKASLQAQYEALTRSINSQSDPAWVELTLMRVLGLVPEGQTKVLFTHDSALLERFNARQR